MTRAFTIAFLVFLVSAASAAELKVPDGFKTISLALEKAKSGDTVSVAAGTYREFVTVPAGVHLLGAGCKNTRIEAPESGCAISVFESTGVWIDGFTLKTDPGIRALDASRSSFTVTDCVFEENGEGVGLQQCFVVTIANNLFRNCGTGVRAARSFARVECNVFEGGPRTKLGVVGIESILYVDRNAVTGGEWGISIAGKQGGRSMAFSVLRSNLVFRTSEGGVRIEDQAPLVARNCAVMDSPIGFFVDYAEPAISHCSVSGVERPWVKLDADTGEEAAFEPDPGVGCLSSNPMFSAPEKGDFSLLEGSSLKGAGVRYPWEQGETAADIGVFPAGGKSGLGPIEDAASRAKMKPDAENIQVTCVDEEYAYLRSIRCDCGGSFQPGVQSLGGKGGRNWDTLTVKCAGCSKDRTLRFDISRFFSERFLVRGK